MVRIKGPLHSDRASKQIGHNIIFKTKGNRSFATSYNKPGGVRKFIPSSKQVQMRVIYGEGVEAWGDLSEGQKDTYRQRAKYKSYSGFNLFMKEWFTTYQWEMYFSFFGQRVYGLFIYAQQ